MELTQEQVQKWDNAVAALMEEREVRAKELKTHGDALGDTKEKLAKINADLSELESLKTAVADMQTKMNRLAVGEDKNRVPIEVKAFDKFIRMGEDRLRATEPDLFKSLSLESDTTAHYLVIPQYMNRIIERVQEVDVMRQLAEVQPCSSDQLIYAYDSGDFSGGWTADTGTRSETTGQTFGQKVIPVHEGYVYLKVSQGLLDDNAFNVESWLANKAGTRLAVLEGSGFITGTGVGQPSGILQDADVSYTAGGHASSLTDDEGSEALVTLVHALKAEYAANGTWLWDRATTAVIRNMKDGIGRPLWIPDYTASAQATVLGHPYRESTTMPDIAANAYPIAFGDFRRGYVIADRIGITVIRDPYSSKSTGLVEFIFRKRVGGKVVLPEAIRKLKIATS